MLEEIVAIGTTLDWYSSREYPLTYILISFRARPCLKIKLKIMKILRMMCHKHIPTEPNKKYNIETY